MIVRVVTSTPPPELAKRLIQFESQFRYPLGTEHTFRIEHGGDNSCFFRAMGEGACFVAEREGRILGIIGVALRRLVIPGGEERLVAYLGDVKIDPAARGGRALLQLASMVKQWIGKRTNTAFSVVMDGTSHSPTHYTGRLGIPLFSEIGKIVVLNIATSAVLATDYPDWVTNKDHGHQCFSRLSKDAYACQDGTPAIRSEMKPLWLVDHDGRACGRLEDTRLAKTLIADNGIEIRSVHLSCFAYEHVSAGGKLLRAALQQAALRSYPTLFVSIPATEAKAFCAMLEELEIVTAPATVFGTSLAAGPGWNINTAEI